MSKTPHVDEDEQSILTLRQCLKDMGEIREIRHSAETTTGKTDQDPLADIRVLLDRSVVCEGGKPYRGEK